jgi:hypothetical protein
LTAVLVAYIKGRMRQRLMQEIREKAYFVAGQPARFRANAEASVSVAVHNAKQFVASLPDNIRNPMISAGTTSNPDKIITLTWLVGGYRPIKSVTVSFKGDGQSDVYWDDPHSDQSESSVIRNDELFAIDIPAKIARLMRHAPLSGSRNPKLD